MRARILICALVSTLTLAGTATAAQAASYVALGDSYASGVGTRDYDESSGGCKRGPDAYPVEVAPRIGASLKFVACGGAKTEDVTGNQLGSLNAGTTDVSISIGGNDAGFSGVVFQCGKPWPTTCWGDIDDAKAFIEDDLPGELDSVYSAIESRAPNAQVAVVGYPYIFSGEECGGAARISEGEQEELNEAGDMLTWVTANRAHAHGFAFVNPTDPFEGHAVCDDSEWINGVSNPTGESFHPNDDGHDAHADLVTAALD